MGRKRLAGWWIGWEDLNWPNLDTHDRIRARAEKMSKAAVTSAVIFGTHFRWDFLPIFELLHDYLATVAEELGQYGIELIDHHSVNLIHRYDTREEMRHVMLHSGPHLPFSPSREAAATWEYKGKRLNDWRMIDVKTRDILYFPQYAGEGFCHRNPEFIEAYIDYAKKLIADTGIKGLMADDSIHYMHFNSCGCPHCRAELKRRAGIDLPPIEDQSFWGNWDNPAWKHWIDLRFDACADFQKALAAALPEGFQLMSCGASGATPNALEMGSDPRKFLEGCTYTNLEMSGNTPPYKHDPVTVNRTIVHDMINASHHQAAAREKGVRSYGTGYGFTEPSANIIWAVNKVLDADCWFCTLKARLGLPDHILKTLPEEGDVIGNAFHFEAEHPTLFNGEQVGQVGVFFSYETRNHTCFGNYSNGYYKDYSRTLELLFQAGISPHTVFAFPQGAKDYPVIILSSALSMTPEEEKAMRQYVASGGKVIATGPISVSECKHTWNLPNHPDVEPLAFFSTIRDGVWHQPAKWVGEKLPASTDPDEWQTPAEGLYYHPHRISEGTNNEEFLSLCRQYSKKMPIEVLESEGYLITMFEGKNGITVHFLAADYDTDIDHHLDEIRFHRSRVNYINKVEPIGVTQTIRVRSEAAPQIFTPFDKAPAQLTKENGVCSISLPQKTSYVILHFPA